MAKITTAKRPQGKPPKRGFPWGWLAIPLIRQRQLSSRRDKVVKLKKAGSSYAEIGRLLGISRERVRQIASHEPTPPKPPEPEPPKAMLTSTDAARLLGVRPNTVRHWSDRGILRAYRLGPRRDRRFRRQDVEALLKEQ